MAATEIKQIISVIVGMILGAFISLVVDSALFEISINGFFSIVFGFCLITIGGLILWRVAPESGQAMSRWRTLVFLFSILVVSSGIFCFALEKQWLTSLGPKMKIPMYTMLGTSLSFALSFSVVDLLNQGVCSCCMSGDGGDARLVKAVVQSSNQVYVILVSSVCLGAIFGFNFGVFDVEDDNARLTRFSKDQLTSSIAGAIGGGIVGYMNQMLREQENNEDGFISNVDNHEDI